MSDVKIQIQQADVHIDNAAAYFSDAQKRTDAALDELKRAKAILDGVEKDGPDHTVYGQRDPRWASIPLGKSTKWTIGSSGCLMCCYASIVTDAGQLMNPAEMNAWLTENGGYAADGEGQIVNFVFGCGDKLNVLKFDDLGRYNDPAPMEKIEKYVQDGGYVIVKVDFDKRTRALEQHWVRYLGNGKIMDPWHADVADLIPRYKGKDLAEAIWAAAYYKSVARGWYQLVKPDEE